MVNGSPTKTEMVDSAGGRSQIAQLTAGAIVVVVLLFLTGPLAYMPNAVLAAVVFLIGVKLDRHRGMADIARLRPGEFAVAAVTAATVVVVGVEQGIILAIGLSIVEHIYHSYRPFDQLLLVGAGRRSQLEPLDGAARRSRPGSSIYRFGASLYYANADPLHRGGRWSSSRPGADPPLRWLVHRRLGHGRRRLLAAPTTSGQVLEELSGARGHAGAVRRRRPRVRALLDAYGLTDEIGADNFYPSRHDVLAAYARQTGGRRRPSTGAAAT